MARRTLAGSRAIVTGASTGIGRELALELARHAVDVVIVARSAAGLEEVAALAADLPGRVEQVAGDITHPDVRTAAIQRAAKVFGGLDILINNAGVGAVGRFEHADPDRLRRVMDVNFFAAVELIRAALPVLRQGIRPIIVNVSSILGRRGIPHMAEYCASKFALAGFSESLRAEVARLGIDVLVVSPGTTATDFHDHLVERTDKPPWPSQPRVPAAVVARAAVAAIIAGKHEVVVGLRGRLLCWLARFSPRLVDRMMKRYG
jgi:short-subunit dehydrogenase